MKNPPFWLLTQTQNKTIGPNTPKWKLRLITRRNARMLVRTDGRPVVPVYRVAW